jgi:S-adenosylmethionine hydrolase
MPRGLITLLTDFGTADAFVGIMKGVILGINPDVRLVDLAHGVPPQQILAGALALRASVPFFPAGTIHVAVVDPGVGGSRQPLLIETGSGILVGPDNGVLCLAAEQMGRPRPRLLANQAFFRQPVSHTFHGRDIFAPVAAHLSRGVPPDVFGPALESIVQLSFPAPACTATSVSGEVIYVDHFGNLVTNIGADALQRFSGQPLSVSIKGRHVGGPVVAYAALPEGSPLAIVGSWGMLEIAVRNGSAAEKFAVGAGAPVAVGVQSGDA